MAAKIFVRCEKADICQSIYCDCRRGHDAYEGESQTHNCSNKDRGFALPGILKVTCIPVKQIDNRPFNIDEEGNISRD